MTLGYCDLHCHLLPGVDDGAKSLEDALAMAQALVALGYQDAAPSPHHRAEYAPRDAAAQAFTQLQAALLRAGVPLTLHPNAENHFLHDHFMDELEQGTARTLGSGKVLLVEAPYSSPLPALENLIFRMRLKGYTPLLAHPERCLEFEKPERALQAVRAGALLQLDLGALTKRYGRRAQQVSKELLSRGLYAVAATDLHGPRAAQTWVGEALQELTRQAGAKAAQQLLRDNPRALLVGQTLAS